MSDAKIDRIKELAAAAVSGEPPPVAEPEIAQEEQPITMEEYSNVISERASAAVYAPVIQERAQAAIKRFAKEDSSGIPKSTVGAIGKGVVRGLNWNVVALAKLANLPFQLADKQFDTNLSMHDAIKTWDEGVKILTHSWGESGSKWNVLGMDVDPYSFAGEMVGSGVGPGAAAFTKLGKLLPFSQLTMFGRVKTAAAFGGGFSALEIASDALNEKTWQETKRIAKERAVEIPLSAIAGGAFAGVLEPAVKFFSLIPALLPVGYARMTSPAVGPSTPQGFDAARLDRVNRALQQFHATETTENARGLRAAKKYFELKHGSEHANAASRKMETLRLAVLRELDEAGIKKFNSQPVDIDSDPARQLLKSKYAGELMDAVLSNRRGIFANRLLRDPDKYVDALGEDASKIANAILDGTQSFSAWNSAFERHATRMSNHFHQKKMEADTIIEILASREFGRVYRTGKATWAPRQLNEKRQRSHVEDVFGPKAFRSKFVDDVIDLADKLILDKRLRLGPQGQGNSIVQYLHDLDDLVGSGRASEALAMLRMHVSTGTLKLDRHTPEQWIAFKTSRDFRREISSQGEYAPEIRLGGYDAAVENFSQGVRVAAAADKTGVAGDPTPWYKKFTWPEWQKSLAMTSRKYSGLGKLWSDHFRKGNLKSGFSMMINDIWTDVKNATRQYMNPAYFLNAGRMLDDNGNLVDNEGERLMQLFREMNGTHEWFKNGKLPIIRQVISSAFGPKERRMLTYMIEAKNIRQMSTGERAGMEGRWNAVKTHLDRVGLTVDDLERYRILSAKEYHRKLTDYDEGQEFVRLAQKIEDLSPRDRKEQFRIIDEAFETRRKLTLDDMKIDVDSWQVSPGGRILLGSIEQMYHAVFESGSSAGVFDPYTFRTNFVNRIVTTAGDSADVLSYLNKHHRMDQVNPHSFRREFETAMEAVMYLRSKGRDVKLWTDDIAELSTEFIEEVGRTLIEGRAVQAIRRLDEEFTIIDELQRGIAKAAHEPPHAPREPIFKSVVNQRMGPTGYMRLGNILHDDKWTRSLPDGSIVGVDHYIREDVGRILQNLVQRETPYESRGVRKLANFINLSKHIMLAIDTYHLGQMMRVQLAFGESPFGKTLDNGFDMFTNPDNANYATVKEAVQRYGLTLNAGDHEVLRAEQMRRWLGERTTVGTVIENVPFLHNFSEWMWQKAVPAYKAHLYVMLLGQRTISHRGLVPLDKIKLEVAQAVNNLFGSMSLTQHMRSQGTELALRTFMLAPAWYETQLRTMFKAFNPKISADDIEASVYQQFFMGDSKSHGKKGLLYLGYLQQSMLQAVGLNALSAAFINSGLADEKTKEKWNKYMKEHPWGALVHGVFPSFDKFGQPLKVGAASRVNFGLEAFLAGTNTIVGLPLLFESGAVRGALAGVAGAAVAAPFGGKVAGTVALGSALAAGSAPVSTAVRAVAGYGKYEHWESLNKNREFWWARASTFSNALRAFFEARDFRGQPQAEPAVVAALKAMVIPPMFFGSVYEASESSQPMGKAVAMAMRSSHYHVGSNYDARQANRLRRLAADAQAMEKIRLHYRTLKKTFGHIPGFGAAMESLWSVEKDVMKTRVKDVVNSIRGDRQILRQWRIISSQVRWKASLDAP